MKTSPKDFFLHLGVIATLYTIAISFLNLAWRIIDRLFPIINPYGYFTNDISAPVATLIIVFPVFLVLSWLLNREYRILPEKRNLWVRKWLVYITLFVAGIVIIVDLIVVLIKFLGGHLITAGFILKALSVIVVALAIFGYYIADLRDKTSRANKTYAWIAGLAVLGLIVGGFSIMGSPRTQRLLNYDIQKVSDLQNIQGQIINYWQRKEELPRNLSDLEDSISGFIVPVDSQNKTAYEYKQNETSEHYFQLCADFNLPSRDSSDKGSVPIRIPVITYDSEQNVWQHDKGPQCFERNIDPELYPPYPPVKN